MGATAVPLGIDYVAPPTIDGEVEYIFKHYRAQDPEKPLVCYHIRRYRYEKWVTPEDVLNLVERLSHDARFAEGTQFTPMFDTCDVRVSQGAERLDADAHDMFVARAIQAARPEKISAPPVQAHVILANLAMVLFIVGLGGSMFRSGHRGVECTEQAIAAAGLTSAPAPVTALSAVQFVQYGGTLNESAVAASTWSLVAESTPTSGPLYRRVEVEAGIFRFAEEVRCLAGDVQMLAWAAVVLLACVLLCVSGRLFASTAWREREAAWVRHIIATESSRSA